ncbi:MAG: serine hydrolase domain-containing protein [Victivallaceae bacterium]
MKKLLLIIAIAGGIGVAAAEAPLRETDRAKLESQYRYLNEVLPAPADGLYIRTGRELPQLVWPDAGPLTVRFYDRHAREVGEFGETGMYLACAEAVSPQFGKMRRMVPFFYRRDGYLPDAARLEAWQKRKFPGQSWGEWLEPDSPKSARMSEKDPARWLALIEKDPDGAKIIANVHSGGRGDDPDSLLASPFVQFYEQAFRTRLAIDGGVPRNRPPRAAKTPPAPVLRPGSEAEAGFKPGAREKLHAAAKAWYELTKEPCSFVVARRGVIVYMESFGLDHQGRPVNENTQMFAASISKFVSGQLFATFIDDGAAEPGDPLSRLLPEFAALPDGTASDLVLQDCFSHTAGLLDRHGSFGGIGNVFADNEVWSIAPGLKSNSPMLYNGDGLNLAGRAMERAAGRPLTELFAERLLNPLAIRFEGITLDLGYSFCLSSMDIAKLGQLMLNRGSYGDCEIYRETTWRKLLPVLPRMQTPPQRGQIGVGMGYRNFKKVDGEGKELDEYIFPPSTFLGHGAASDALLIFSLGEELVVASSRNAPGDPKAATRGRIGFIQAVADNLLPLSQDNAGATARP